MYTPPPQPQPAYYGPPPGPAPVGMMMPRRQMLETEKGISTLKWTLVIAIVVAAILLALGILSLSISTTASTNPEGAAKNISSIAALICAIPFLILIWLITVIIGIIYMNQGKEEFGPVHKKSVTLGTVFFVQAIIMVVLVISSPFLMIFSIPFGTGTDPATTWNAIRAFATIFTIFAMLVPICFSLMYRTMPIAIADVPEKKLLTIALIFGIVFPAMGGGTSLGVLYSVDSSKMTSQQVSSLSTLSQSSMLLAQGLFLVAVVIFFIAYLRTSAKISSGALSPGAIMQPLYGVVMPSQPQPVAQPPLPICPNCRGTIPFGAGTCPACGTRLQ